MNLVDEYTFEAAAGDGGDGVVRWRREKFIPKGGPNGGDGGRGGDVLAEAVRDINMLGRISHVRAYRAENGQPGASASKHGRDGEHVVIKLPVGSVIVRQATGERWELLQAGERITLVRGGAGGLGNEHFKSSTNQQPREATPGSPGDKALFTVELRLIADVGLVGLPNAGKSSLLNVLTNAHAKVGSYEFTTLDPNLGVFYGYVIADIPGLIEGAALGKGLGLKFLRHVARTRCILHCISLEGDDVLRDYAVVRHEIESFPGVNEKPEIIVLTKTDSVSEDAVVSAEKLFRSQGKEVLSVSVLDDVSVKKVRDYLTLYLEKAV